MGSEMRLRGSRAYVLLCFAQGIRGMGFWISWLGMLSLASFTLHATAGQIVLVTAATALPHILFSPITGTIVDRTNAKWMLIATFALNIGTSLALVFVNAIWQIYLVAFVWSIAGAIVWPSLGVILKQIVPDESLARANGVLNSFWETTLIAGPPLSGLLATYVDARAPMKVGAVFYLVGMLVLLPMSFTPNPAAKPEPGMRLHEMRQGLTLIMRLRDLRTLALWGAIAWGGMNVILAVEPIFVRDTLHGGESMLAWFYSVGGIGATLGSLLIGWLRFARHELRTAAIGLVVTGIFFALYVGIARWPIVLPIQFFIGMGFAVYMTLSITLVQRRSPQPIVGRALAAKRGLDEGAGFIGAMLAVGVASALGARTTMFVAVGVLTAAAIVLLVRSIVIAESVAEAAAAAIAAETGSPPEQGAAADFERELLAASPSLIPSGIDPLHDRAGMTLHLPVPDSPFEE